MTSLEESWEVTIKNLKDGRKLLPEEIFSEEAKVFDKEFTEYIEHNELELAMNSLDDLGLLLKASNMFWHHLELAAINMGLASDAKRFKNKQST